MSEPNQKPGWLQNPRVLLLKILQLNDSPHHIALGVAIGMFIGMTPTVGVQMAIVMLFALMTKRLFYFNRVAALITVYISNPLTMVPIYYGLYWVGSWFVSGTATREDFARILEYDSFATWWKTVLDLFVGIGTPLLIGTAIVATVSGLMTYPVMLYLVNKFRRTHPPAEIAMTPDPKNTLGEDAEATTALPADRGSDRE